MTETKTGRRWIDASDSDDSDDDVRAPIRSAHDKKWDGLVAATKAVNNLLKNADWNKLQDGGWVGGCEGSCGCSRDAVDTACMCVGDRGGGETEGVRERGCDGVYWAMSRSRFSHMPLLTRPSRPSPPPLLLGRADLPKLETALETAKSEIAAELPKLTANKAHSAAVGALRYGAHVACACAFVFVLCVCCVLSYIGRMRCVRACRPCPFSGVMGGLRSKSDTCMLDHSSPCSVSGAGNLSPSCM